MNYFCHRSTPPMKTKSYSRIYRIIHWAIVICFTFLLLTIFLRMTWLNKFNIAEIIGDFLTTKNQQLSEEELIQLGKQIRKPMWNWHIDRSEEHTSELQSRPHLVCRLLLEKKK